MILFLVLFVLFLVLLISSLISSPLLFSLLYSKVTFSDYSCSKMSTVLGSVIGLSLFVLLVVAVGWWWKNKHKAFRAHHDAVVLKSSDPLAPVMMKLQFQQTPELSEKSRLVVPGHTVSSSAYQSQQDYNLL